jgi:regulator of replication initiation timing
MESLEDRQREMKKRNTRKERGVGLALPEVATNDSPEVVGLKKCVAELKEQVVALQMENNRLREQKTIVVERPREQERSAGDAVREQQHNFFKYSNARNRY